MSTRLTGVFRSATALAALIACCSLFPALAGEETDGPAAGPAGDDEPPRGKVVAKVATRHDAGQSYALYLPKAYTPEKKWPILYGFSPAARGTDPVRLFKDAAEKHGWIVVGSNNSQNGPHEPIQQAIEALLRDTKARFSLDENRRYATGFSGGARVAFFLAASADPPFAGVIPCGAGMPSYMKPLEKGNRLAVAAIVGDKDFNYQELLRLEGTLRKTEVRSRLAVFEGEHRWPPFELAASAVDYMEILRQTIPDKGSEEALAALFRTEADAADRQSRVKGQFLRGHEHLAGLCARVRGTAVEKELTDRLAAIEASERYAKERELLDAFGKLQADHARAEQSDEAFAAAIQAFGKFAADHPDTDAGLRAAGAVMGAGYRMAMRGTQLHQAKRYAEAAIWLRRGRAIYPKDPTLAYNLACALARDGQKAEALKALAEAVELGFRNFEHMRADADLEALREEPDFRRLLERAAPSPAPAPAGTAPGAAAGGGEQ
jgi:dienelactone hydrolase